MRNPPQDGGPSPAQAPDPVADGEDRYLDVDGARLRYRDGGAGPSVVLMHGWTLDLDMWDPQVAVLVRDWRTIRFDRRGHGRSTGSCSPAVDVADALALCRHLGVRRAAFVGMSQAARAAVAIAAGGPQCVSCIVLDGAPPGLADAPDTAAGPDLPLDDYRALMRSGGTAAFLRSWRGHPMATLRTGDRQAHALVQRMMSRYSGADLVQAPQAPAAPPALNGIRQPALVLAGEFDVASRRAAAAAIARALPAARLQSVPDAGHLSNLDNPAAYNAALLDFLRQHAAS